MDAPNHYVALKDVGLKFGLCCLVRNGEKDVAIPYIKIDLGKNHQPLGDRLSFNNKLFLEFKQQDNDRFFYELKGDCIRTGYILDDKGKMVDCELVFDFSVTMTIDGESHREFQERLAEINYWLLHISASIESYITINRDHTIKDIIEIKPSPQLEISFN